MSQITNQIRPLFILGVPRSGTSLMQSLLDGHPQLLVDAGESKFFRRFYPKAKRKSYSQQVILANNHLLHLFNADDPYYKKYLSVHRHLLVFSEVFPDDRDEAGLFTPGLSS